MFSVCAAAEDAINSSAKTSAVDACIQGAMCFDFMSSFSVSVEGLVAMPVLKNSARCEENLLSTTMGAPLRETIEGLETLTTEYRKQRLSGEDRQQFTSEPS